MVEKPQHDDRAPTREKYQKGNAGGPVFWQPWRAIRILFARFRPRRIMRSRKPHNFATVPTRRFPITLSHAHGNVRSRLDFRAPGHRLGTGTRHRNTIGNGCVQLWVYRVTSVGLGNEAVSGLDHEQIERYLKSWTVLSKFCYDIHGFERAASPSHAHYKRIVYANFCVQVGWIPSRISM
jgi:hypothetical protein